MPNFKLATDSRGAKSTDPAFVQADLHGAPGDSWDSGVKDDNDTTEVELVAAGATGVRHYLTEFTFTNLHASAAIQVILMNGATVKRQCSILAGTTLTLAFPKPLRGAAATNWQFKLSGSHTSVKASASGYSSSR